jgi:Holliday junction DNA helicase RuvA
VIARLHGHLAAIEDGAVVVDVAGVGYRVRVPASALAELGPEGALVTLHTRLVVRDNEVALYGATDPEAMVLFDALLGVTGVGPRLALAMLSTFDAATLGQAIVAEDIARLSQASGVGRKTAQRIVLELKGRLEADGRYSGVAASAPVGPEEGEAEAALISLGYTRGEARRALTATNAAGGTVESRILAALHWLSG